jgi:ABC-type sulfate transport system permease subunit
MGSESGNRRRIIGTLGAVSLFTAWILVDTYVFPLIGISTHYPLYEIVAYGSWAIITIVVFLMLSWAGWFPMRQDRHLSDSANAST